MHCIIGGMHILQSTLFVTAIDHFNSDIYTGEGEVIVVVLILLYQHGLVKHSSYAPVISYTLQGYLRTLFSNLFNKINQKYYALLRMD